MREFFNHFWSSFTRGAEFSNEECLGGALRYMYNARLEELRHRDAENRRRSAHRTMQRPVRIAHRSEVLNVAGNAHDLSLAWCDGSRPLVVK